MQHALYAVAVNSGNVALVYAAMGLLAPFLDDALSLLLLVHLL